MDYASCNTADKRIATALSGLRNDVTAQGFAMTYYPTMQPTPNKNHN